MKLKFVNNQNLLVNGYMKPLDASQRPGQDDPSGAEENPEQ